MIHKVYKLYLYPRFQYYYTHRYIYLKVYSIFRRKGVIMNSRRIKGEQIAKTVQIQKKGLDRWVVPSQTGRGEYTVNRVGENFKCTCPDFELRGQVCKHIYAVEIKVMKWFDSNGNYGTEITIKKTWTQNWVAYDKSQKEEKVRFMELYKDLLESVEEPTYTFGRPKIARRDMLFASALKVYTQFSLRRFQSDLAIAKEKGFIGHTASFTGIGKFMQNPEITPILHKLIQLSAMPLQGVEDKFAVDSTGFRTTLYTEYCKEKHGIRKHHTPYMALSPRLSCCIRPIRYERSAS